MVKVSQRLAVQIGQLRTPAGLGEGSVKGKAQDFFREVSHRTISIVENVFLALEKLETTRALLN